MTASSPCALVTHKYVSVEDVYSIQCSSSSALCHGGGGSEGDRGCLHGCMSK